MSLRGATPLAPSERRTLERWARGIGASARLRQRARIVLAASRGAATAEIARRLNATPETVARWRERFRTMRLDGLAVEAPRAGAARRVGDDVVGEVLRATLDRAPGPDRGWTTRSLARALGTSHMTVHRIWRSYGLSPGTPERGGEPTAPARVDLAGVYRTPTLTAIVFEHRPSPVSRGGRRRARPGTPDPAVAAGELIGALRATEPTEPRVRSPGRSSGALLVFLRAAERAAPPSARLDAILDRPAASLDPRIGHWLDAHSRYRLYSPGAPEEWGRTVEAWFRRWETVPLDPASFRALHAYHRRSVRAAADPRPAGSYFAPRRRAGRVGAHTDK